MEAHPLNPYRTILVAPIAGAMGALIEGVDLARTLSNEARAEIHHAFLEQQMIAFLRQSLTPQ